MREGQENVIKLHGRVARALRKTARMSEFGQLYNDVNISELALSLNASRSSVSNVIKSFHDSGLIESIGNTKRIYVGTEHGVPLRDVWEKDAIPSYRNRYGYKLAERDLMRAGYRMKALVAQAATGRFMADDFIPVWMRIDSTLMRTYWLTSSAVKILAKIKNPSNKKALIKLCSELADNAKVMRDAMLMIKHNKNNTMSEAVRTLCYYDMADLQKPIAFKTFFVHFESHGISLESTVAPIPKCTKSEKSTARVIKARVLPVLVSFQDFCCDLSEEKIHDFESRFFLLQRLVTKLGKSITHAKSTTTDTPKNKNSRDSFVGVVVAKCDDEGLLNYLGHRVQAEFGLFYPYSFLYEPTLPRQKRFFKALKSYARKTTIGEEDLLAGLIALYRYEDARGSRFNYSPTAGWLGSPACMNSLLTVAMHSAKFAPTFSNIHEDLQNYFESWLDAANSLFLNNFGVDCEGAYGAALVDLNKYRALESMLLYRCQTPDKTDNLWHMKFIHSTGNYVTPREYLYAQVRAMNTGGYSKVQRLPDTRLLLDPLGPMRAVQFVASKPAATPAPREERDAAQRILAWAGVIPEVVN